MDYQVIRRKTEVILLITLIMTLILCSLYSVKLFSDIKSCTIVTMSQDNKVYFANNEDFHFGDLYIGFYPDGGYGSVHFGYKTNGQLNYEGAVNDAGLCWDVNSVPKSNLNPQIDKLFTHAEYSFLSNITKNAATVDEAVAIAKQYDFGESLLSQFHVADTQGNAVVISAGEDGEIAFTYKEPFDRYFVSTNFNVAHANTKDCWRHDTAVDMLESTNDYSPEFGRDLLDAVSLRTITSFTMYSNINDLVNNKIYLYYMSQYGEVAVIDIDSEMEKGQRIISMSDLFSDDTVLAGDTDYRRFEIRFTIVKVFVITFVIGLLALIILLIVRKIKRQKKTAKI